MNDETLFDKARQNVDVARMIFSSSQGDEIYLNYVGYHLQQAVELGIKYGMECFGVEYPRVHDITQLILKCRDAGIDIGVTDYIDEHSEMFTQWEANATCINNYHLESRKITKAFEGVSRFLDSVAKIVKQICDANTSNVSRIEL